MLAVGVERHEAIIACAFGIEDGGLNRAAVAQIAQVRDDGGAGAVEHGGRAVERPVVDDEEVAVGQVGADALDHGADCGGLVVRRNGNQRPARDQCHRQAAAGSGGTRVLHKAPDPPMSSRARGRLDMTEHKTFNM